jgi:hypothetical protein
VELESATGKKAAVTDIPITLKAVKRAESAAESRR